MWCNARPVSRLFGAASKAGGVSSVVGWAGPAIQQTSFVLYAAGRMQAA